MPYKDGILTNTYWGTEGGKSCCGYGGSCSIAQNPHAGDDVCTSTGAPVFALADGVVYRSRNGGVQGYFQEITIKYDVRDVSEYVDYVWVLYGHMLKDSILPAGTKIKRGQLIGKVGTRADAMGTPPHDHVEMWATEVSAAGYVNSKAINPKYIREVLEPRVVPEKKITHLPTVEEDTGRVGYKIVDLRGKIPGSAQASQGRSKKKRGVVLHYNGDPDGTTNVVDGRRTPKEVYASDAAYHIQKNWGTPGQPAYTNGIQYHYGVYDDTVYILRDPDAKIWHCADGTDEDSYNYSATAVNVPVSQNERVNARTLITLEEFMDDEMARQGHSKRYVKGHQEISSTACPGDQLMAFLKSYRSKPMDTPARPAPGGAKDPGFGALFGYDYGVSEEEALAWCLSKGAHPDRAPQAIRAIYSVKNDETAWRPVIRAAQSFLETGGWRYGHDSRPWNMAGVKKGGNVGDEPQDFEVPATPEAGAHMQANHGRAYSGKDAVAPVHPRFRDARAAQQGRGNWVTHLNQLGGGIWATDTSYAKKIKTIIRGMQEVK